VTDGGGNQTFHYLYGLNVDQVLAQDSPSGMVWALADRLGSIDALTDGNGVVVDKRTFDSFGRILSETNPSVSFRYGYTGRERDLESGLDYYRARYYDPQVGRFISVDPMGFGAGDTNLYRYVGNSSTNAIDPSGEISWSDVQNYAQQGWNNFSQSAQNISKFYTGVAVDAGTSISQSVSQFRLPSLNEVGQGLRDFGRSWDTATNFWSREVVQPIANSLSSATQNSVNSYINLVRDGQHRGGVIGTLEQGVGYFGGTLASVPGGIADTVSGFVKAHPVLTTRIGGVGRAVGGVIEIAGGLATSEFGIGVLAMAKGIDDLQAGLRQAWTGQKTNSLMYGAVKNLTGSSNLAEFVDTGTSLAANSAAYNSLKSFRNCFIAGTEIQTRDGTKNIEDLHVGDWVLSDDPTTPGDIEYKQVLQTFAHDTTKFVDVYIGGEKITTTEEHPFWVPDVGWVMAKDLHAGSHLQTKTESWLDVDKVDLHGGLATVYNFEVAGFHTYFVSDLGLLVHNDCAVLVPPQTPLIDLSAQEALGGHSIARHGSGLRLSELRARVAGTHPTMPQSRSALKFINDYIHEDAVNKAYAKYSTDIQNHFASGGAYKSWTFDYGSPTGAGFTNIATRANPTIIPIQPSALTKVTISFAPDPLAPGGFRLDSAYPAYP
jgi:RHS repeat-associated protein